MDERILDPEGMTLIDKTSIVIPRPLADVWRVLEEEPTDELDALLSGGGGEVEHRVTGQLPEGGHRFMQVRTRRDGKRVRLGEGTYWIIPMTETVQLIQRKRQDDVHRVRYFAHAKGTRVEVDWSVRPRPGYVLKDKKTLRRLRRETSRHQRKQLRQLRRYVLRRLPD